MPTVSPPEFSTTTPETGSIFDDGPGDSGPSRRRPTVRWVVRGLAAILLVAAGAAYWALDTYVLDHVEVADVAAFESEVLAESPIAEAIASTPDIDPTSATITDDTYVSDTVEISIETVVEGTGADTVTYYVADVQVTDAALLRAGFAENKFGENIIDDTSEIAEMYDAVFAINGDYYGFRDTGIVIRNGVVYRDDGARTGLVAYLDGTMEVYDETTTSAEELLADGAWNTWSFGPAIVDDGVVLDGIEDVEVETNFGNHSIQGEQPRTGVGVIDANHFVFVVVDGRSTGYSRGVTMTEFADIFVELGATTAYNLDGGGSSTMVFDGELVNDPLGKGTERGTSDILYIG